MVKGQPRSRVNGRADAAELRRQPAWLALSVSIPLSYLPQLTSVAYFPVVYLLVWVPFFCFLVRWPRWSID